MTLAAILLLGFIVLLPSAVTPFLAPILAFYNFLNPLGVICLTFGWATLATAYSKKTAFVMPLLYAAVVVAMAVSFLVPL